MKNQSVQKLAVHFDERSRRKHFIPVVQLGTTSEVRIIVASSFVSLGRFESCTITRVARFAIDETVQTLGHSTKGTNYETAGCRG